METDDILEVAERLPLVAKKYSTFSENGNTPSHLLTTVCRQQLGLILEWCNEHGIECFEDTHRHTIVQKHLAEPLNLVDDFRRAKDDFFESVGVSNIDDMNEFSQGWDGFQVSCMDDLVIKLDKVSDFENAIHALDTLADDIDGAVSEMRPHLDV